MTTARQAWLVAHPWLAPVAAFQAIVDAPLGARAQAAAPPLAPADRDAGVPLLRTASGGPLVQAAADALAALLVRLDAADLPGPVGDGARALRATLRTPDALREATERVVAGSPGTGRHAGLLQLLGWAAVRHALGDAARGPASDDASGWGHAGCPTCGALPTMAQLASCGEGRARLLACGRCRTRWRWARAGCPFCGNEAPDRLAVLEVEGEERLRLDTCAECRGYLKTYAGEGDEELFLADWPTLHLDVLAHERGLERRGASLYEI